jgi:hypothetical protein
VHHYQSKWFTETSIGTASLSCQSYPLLDILLGRRWLACREHDTQVATGSIISGITGATQQALCPLQFIGVALEHQHRFLVTGSDTT